MGNLEESVTVAHAQGRVLYELPPKSHHYHGLVIDSELCRDYRH